MTSHFNPDPERLERFGIEGVCLRSVPVPGDGTEMRESPLEPGLEIPHPLAPLPESEMEDICTGIDLSELSGIADVHCLHARFLTLPDGSNRIVGCVANGSGEVLGDEWHSRVTVAWSGHGSFGNRAPRLTGRSFRSCWAG